MTKLITKYYDGGSTSNLQPSNAILGFLQGGGYGMIALGFGGFVNKFPTPNADLNSNNLMAALARDGVSNALLMSGNPYAMAAGAAVKVIDKTGGFSDVSEGLGTGTDVANAIASFALPGAGWFMNNSKTNEYKMSANMKVMSSGYAGSVKDAKTAESNAGAKLLFGRNKANNMIDEAKFKDDLISQIKQASDADFQSARSMTQQRAMANQYALMGGYHQAYARAGKLGLKLERTKQLAIKFKEPSEIKEQEVYVMKDGGEFFALLKQFVPTTEEQNKAFFDTLLTEEEIQKFLNGGKSKKKDRELSELIEYAKKQNPRFVLRMSEPLKDIEFTDVHGNVSRGTHYMADDPDGIVYPTIQEMEDGSLKYFENRDEARERAIKNNNYLLFETSNEANNFARNYKQGWPDFFGLKQIDGKWYKSDGEDENGKRYIDQEGGLYYFKEGGQMNVIPEGSLHARLHHMDNADNLTKKGIPVVDNKGNQQAEIEHSEIIFTKEVTDKLEELYKKFKSDEYTNKEKENFAIEAGKLLSKEIIENTDDRVGLLDADKFAEGGMFGQPESPMDPSPTSTTAYTGEEWFRRGFAVLNTKYPALLSLYIMRHAASEGDNKTGHYQLGGNGGNVKNTSRSTNPSSMLTYASQMMNKYGGENKFKAAKSWADYLGLLFRPDFLYNEEYSTNSKYLPMKANSYRVNGLLPDEAVQAYKSGYNQNNFVKSKYGPYTTINNWVTRLVADYNKNNPKNPILNIDYTL